MLVASIINFGFYSVLYKSKEESEDEEWQIFAYMKFWVVSRDNGSLIMECFQVINSWSKADVSVNG